MEKIWKFIKEEDGLELTEYAIMGGLIVVATITVIGALGDKILAIFTNLDTTLGTATP